MCRTLTKYRNVQSKGSEQCRELHTSTISHQYINPKSCILYLYITDCYQISTESNTKNAHHNLKHGMHLILSWKIQISHCTTN